MEAQWYNVLPKEAVAIRTEVFMNEPGFQNEFDDIDHTCLHVVIWDKDTYIACGRLILEGDCAHLGRIAVLKPYRRQKTGSFLVNRMIEKAQEIGCKYVWLSAQSRVHQFYQSLGFLMEGEEYMDEHCPHVNMKKPIG